MTLQQFLAIYKFEFTGQVLVNSTYVAFTKVIRLSDNKVVDRIKTSIDIYEMNDFLEASQSPFSATPMDWNQIIDQTKRGQLDFYAQRVPISDFYPMNSETDISTLV
jgi:hypothetical protein